MAAAAARSGFGNPDLSRVPEVAPIGVVQAFTGLSARQIRYYEARGLVVPARTAGNRRLYTREQVEQLLEIRRLLASGFTVDAVQALWEARGREDGEPAGRVTIADRAAPVAGRSPESGPAPEIPQRAGERMPRRRENLFRVVRDDLDGQVPWGRQVPSLYPLRRRDQLLRRLDRVQE